MHNALRKEFKNLKILSQEKNVPLALIETKLENIIFISSGKRIVCLALEEGKIHNVLSCFRVDLNKWVWAEKEGFSIEKGIPEILTNEILIKFHTSDEYLDYLGL